MLKFKLIFEERQESTNLVIQNSILKKLRRIQEFSYSKFRSQLVKKNPSHLDSKKKEKKESKILGFNKKNVMDSMDFLMDFWITYVSEVIRLLQICGKFETQ